MIEIVERFKDWLHSKEAAEIGNLSLHNAVYEELLEQAETIQQLRDQNETGKIAYVDLLRISMAEIQQLRDLLTEVLTDHRDGILCDKHVMRKIEKALQEQGQ